MTNLAIKETVEVAGIAVPNINGGFGEGKKSMLAKHIAEIHSKELKKVNEVINNNKERFKDDIDIIDVKGTEFEVVVKDHGIMSQNGINRASNIYLLSERGYAKLIKLFNDDKSWELYDTMLDEYFDLRDANVIQMNNQPSSQLQIMQMAINQLVQQEQQMLEIKNKQDSQDLRLSVQENKVVAMADFITQVPDFKEIQNAINVFSRRSGMTSQEVRAEVYKRISDTHGINFKVRVKNAQDKLQQERLNSGKKAYSDNTLKQKVNIMTIIKEEKLEKKMLEILMIMTGEIK